MARRPTNRLSAREVDTIKEPGRHADGGGLYLQVDDSGARRWVFVFQWRGKRKEMGLGGTSVVSLRKAREVASAARVQVHEGKNPIDARRASAVAGQTFGEVADELMAGLEPTWRNAKHGDQWKLSLDVYAKALRPRPPADITTEDILDVLKPIWTRIPETAARTRGRIERVLDAARAKGVIQPPWENPARWRGHLQILLGKRERLTKGHHPALPFDQAPAFMVALRTAESVGARALEWTILAAARTSETLGARFSELDLDEMVWTIPGERMKAGVEHRVPITPPMLAILEKMRPLGYEGLLSDLGDAYIFPGALKGRPLSNMTMDMALRRLKYDHVSVHGFRSTFRDWAGESTTFPEEIAEQALAHTVGSKVRRAYRRGDALLRRRKLMEAWAAFLGRPAGGNVKPMQRPNAGKSGI